jgi:hypothetical protein
MRAPTTRNPGTMCRNACRHPCQQRAHRCEGARMPNPTQRRATRTAPTRTNDARTAHPDNRAHRAPTRAPCAPLPETKRTHARTNDTQRRPTRRNGTQRRPQAPTSPNDAQRRPTTPNDAHKPPQLSVRVGARARGCACAWVRVRVGARARGCACAWVRVRVGARARGCACACACIGAQPGPRALHSTSRTSITLAAGP